MTGAIDPFAEYGEQTARTPKPRPTNHAREALQKVQKEKRDLGRVYRMQRDAWLFQTLACPEGPRLTKLVEWVRTLGPGDADELVSVLRGETWLLEAGPDLRFAALQLIGDEIARIRKSAGLIEFDDPVFVCGDEPNETVFFIVKNILGVR